MKRSAAFALAVSAVASGFAVLPQGHAVAATPTETAACSAMTTPIYQHDATNRSLLTKYQSEANGSSNYGFNTDKGSPFKASKSTATGLVPVHRLYNKHSTDFVWMPEGTELNNAVNKYGYTDQGIDFYASNTSLSCTIPVYRLQKGATHRYTSDPTERSTLMSQGWGEGFVVFYVAKNQSTTTTPTPVGSTNNLKRRLPVNINPAGDADGKFSIAVEPDTQGETHTGEQRMNRRSQYILDNKASKDYRYMLGGGDVVNWGWLVPSQFKVASDSMTMLEKAGLPYSLAIGNHDSAAVGYDESGKSQYGGSAYADPNNMAVCQANLELKAAGVPCNTHALIRYTKAFDNTFTADRFGDVEGAFEQGKVDNVFSTFEAANKKFLVLDLEFDARNEVIDWANKVADEHKDYNIIVVTHSYLDGNPNISTNHEYGDNSGQDLYNKFISKHDNVKMVFSGHAGTFANSVSTRSDGTKVANFMTTMHAPAPHIPLRNVEIDVVHGTITSSVVDVNDNSTYSGSNVTVTGMNFI